MTALVCLGGAMLLLYAIILYPFTPPISDLRKTKHERPTTITSSDGQVLTVLKPVNREWVDLEDISPHVLDALISTEDHRFFDHSGVDVIRIFGAGWHTLTGRRQGGSTITQQLARNLYPDKIGRSVTIGRKLKEMITAFKIEYVFEKEEILETYLNTVPFLYNAYGIEMAARTYFSKSASDLDRIEAATLVGMLKGTYYYNPVRNPDRALSRRNVVLAQMAKHGHIDDEERQNLRERPLGLRFDRQPEPEAVAPHFVEHVRDWLIEWADRRGYNIYRDSLTVHTTIDTRIQRLAEAAVDRWMPALQAVAAVEWSHTSDERIYQSVESYRYDRRRSPGFEALWDENSELITSFIRATPQFRAGVDAGLEEDVMLDSLRSDATFMDALREVKTRLETGFVSMDPRDGHVLAWVGSRDFDDDQFDHVAQARRQPGSTFKPFVYAAALERGMRPDDTFLDGPVEIRLAGGEVWQPRNAGGYSETEMTLADGLVYSKNTITAQLIEEVGTRRVASLARRMGITRSSLDEVPSMALGTSSVSLLEMTAAYATIASGGIYREPVMVTRIEDRDGRTVYEAEPESRRVLKEETALILIDMMRGVVDRGTGRRVRTTFGINEDVAGKTGTTQNSADGWFILMHPTMVAGSWVGFNDPRITFRSNYWGQGGNNAALIVGDYFRRAFASSATRMVGIDFPAPPELEDGSDSFFARVGGWIAGAAESIGGWIADGFNRLFGSEPEPLPDDASPADDDAAPRLARDDQAEADSLNRIERESTQLSRVLDELRRQRGETAEPPPPPEEEAIDAEEETEEAPVP